MKNRNRLIMGSAISLAMIATAIDHTRHRVPAAEANMESMNIIIEGEESTSPCSLNSGNSTSSPCSL
jgi:hypothetical protein